MKAIAEQELSRPAVIDPTPKWRIRFRIYTNSHSLREKELSEWNQNLDEVIKLTVGNRKEADSWWTCCVQEACMSRSYGKTDGRWPMHSWQR